MTVFTFHLRKDVTWHDGHPFTAGDVIFSFTRQVVEPYRYVKYMNALKGSRDYTEGKSDEVEGLELIDQYTIRITLGAQDSLFLRDLTEPSCVIVPQHLLEDIAPEAIESAAFTTKSPVGTGPYKFLRYLTDQFVEMEANPNYFQGAPKIEKLFMKRLRPGGYRGPTRERGARPGPASRPAGVRSTVESRGPKPDLASGIGEHLLELSR